MIFVISGPGGVGKGTLVRELLARDDRLWLSRSWTTRPRRDGEAPDAYHFVTAGEFRAHADAGGFLEWVEFLDYLQGSPLPQPPPGHDVVFEIDVHGARQILERYPDAISIFVDSPDRDEQRRRLEGRGDPPERITQRLAKAEEEAAVARDLGSIFVINDELDRAVAEVEAIIARARGATPGTGGAGRPC